MCFSALANVASRGMAVTHLPSTVEHVPATVTPSPPLSSFHALPHVGPQGVVGGRHSEIVWAKNARGVWGLGHRFHNQLYFTRGIPEHQWVPKGWLPAVSAGPPTHALGAAQSIPMHSGVQGEVVQGQERAR